MKQNINLGIISLGCPKNTADTENILSLLSKKLKLNTQFHAFRRDKNKNYPVRPSFSLTNPESADIVLINTCGFLKAARDEVFENIREFKNKKIIIIGCLAGKFTRQDLIKYPQVFAVVTEKNYQKLPEIIKRITRNKKVYEVSEEPFKFIKTFGKSIITPRSYAYVKIAEGCNNRCSYCLIPHLKGRYRSRKMEEILDEAKMLIKKGVKELILVAQDCGYYGQDLNKKDSRVRKITLSVLLQKLEKIPGDFWISILYVYPERITDELLHVIANSKKICRYLDIPLQQGDAKILKAMNRGSIPELIIKKIEKIRKIIPRIALRTSLITGFPGEKEENFKNLVKFLKQINFDHVGVFEYSREPGTAAYGLPGQVSKNIKSLRRAELMRLQQKISLAHNKSFVSKTFKTLIERFDPQANIYIGRTTRLSPEIDGEVIIKSAKKLQLNSFQKIKITKTSEYDLYGIEN